MARGRVYVSEIPVPIGQLNTAFECVIRDHTGPGGGEPPIVDVSGAQTLQISFQDPAGTVTTETAVFSTDGRDGKIRFVDAAGDKVNARGSWKYWGRVTISPTDGPYYSTPLWYPVKPEGS